MLAPGVGLHSSLTDLRVALGNLVRPEDFESASDSEEEGQASSGGSDSEAEAGKALTGSPSEDGSAGNAVGKAAAAGGSTGSAAGGAAAASAKPAAAAPHTAVAGEPADAAADEGAGAVARSLWRPPLQGAPPSMPSRSVSPSFGTHMWAGVIGLPMQFVH